MGLISVISNKITTLTHSLGRPDFIQGGQKFGTFLYAV